MESNQQLNGVAPQSGGVSTFDGYPLPTSNTTYTPNHFFDVVLPYSSRGVLRLVGYMIRRVLGWSNPDGTPREPQVRVSYAELIDKAGISRGAIHEAITEAIKARFIQCVSAGQCNRPNQSGSSSLFELRWDDREQYVTDPAAFNGFFSGNGNLTYIPNAFFDYTVRHESLSLVRVVGAIIRHSIGFQTKHGFRRQEISLSFDDLLRITRLESRSTVNIALQEALEHQHVVRLKTGSFGNGHQSKATYGIKWNHMSEPPKDWNEVVIQVENSQAVQKSNQENIEVFDGNGSKIEPGKLGTVQKSNQGTVQKSNQGTVQKSNQERFKNRTSIEITDLNNINKQQQQTVAAVSVVGFALLTELGFDSNSARELSAKAPEEVIRSQIAWLPKRKASKNRLGLLRRAIEENWASPESESLSPKGRAGEAFARHYYASYHGTTEPTVAPFPKDCSASESFLQKLGLEDNEEKAVESGRAFGKLVRGKHQADPKAKPFLTTALVLFGNEFSRTIQKKTTEHKRSASKTAQDAHRRANWGKYIEYLRQEEKALQKANSELYGAFLKERQQNFKAMQQFKLDPTRFQTEEARLVAYAEFFAQHDENRVLDFWEWDSQMNENCFAREAANE